MIAKKIKTLRKNKNLTQSELAESLAVTAQTVSKWENGLTSPDIALLPVIARFFGITMDDLFNYRLDSLSYKEKFIGFMAHNGMLRFGEFKLKSGRISPYYIHGGSSRNSSQIAQLGRFYADCIREHCPDAELLLGNTQRQIPIVIATSLCLYNEYGSDIEYCVDYSLDNISKTEKTVLITDTFTSGNTLKALLVQIKSKFGTYPQNIIVSVDRNEMSSSEISARKEIERDFGVKIHSIVTFDDIINAIQNNVIAGADKLCELKKYRKDYGSK